MNFIIFIFWGWEGVGVGGGGGGGARGRKVAIFGGIGYLAGIFCGPFQN